MNLAPQNGGGSEKWTDLARGRLALFPFFAPKREKAMECYLCENAGRKGGGGGGEKEELQVIRKMAHS